MKSWLILMAAIFTEVGGTTCIKFSDGFTNLIPTVGVFVLYGLSFWGLSIALRDIEMGTAYAVWSGVGTVLVACIGFTFFGDKATALKLASITLIIAGVIGLKFAGAE